MSRKCAVIAALMVILVPAAARAEWLFTPLIGTTFGADTFGQQDAMYTFALATVDEDLFGWEGEVSYAPDFFTGVADTLGFPGSGNVASGMVDALIGAPFNAHGGITVRPYVTGGVGIMRMHVVSGQSDLFTSTTREFGWNLGLGAMTFFGSHLGLRGDLRYLRSFQNQNPSWTQGTNVDIAPGNFDFWRGSVGVTFRFNP